MTGTWIRRLGLVLVASATAFVAACGGGSTVSDFHPDRAIALGDAFMDVGQDGYLFTVNDGSPFWLQQIVGEYQLTLTPEAQGGFGYAQGRACVSSANPACQTSARSVAAQVDALLQRTALGHDDVVFMGGGIQDVVSSVQAALDAGTPPDELEASVTPQLQAAGETLAALVRRVYQAGVGHMLVTGVYNLGDTPWAHRLDISGPVERLGTVFNNALLLNLIGINDTAHVLFVDTALLSNLAYNNRHNDFGFDNRDDPACTTPDVTTCNASTVVTPDYDRYLFADDIYFTPTMLRYYSDDGVGESIYWRIRDTW